MIPRTTLGGGTARGVNPPPLEGDESSLGDTYRADVAFANTTRPSVAALIDAPNVVKHCSGAPELTKPTQYCPALVANASCGRVRNIPPTNAVAPSNFDKVLNLIIRFFFRLDKWI